MKKKIRITCVGDSITFGHGVFFRRKTLSYPALLEKKFGGAAKVTNLGVESVTLEDTGLIPYTKTRSYTKSLKSDPDIVTIKLGTNDSWTGWDPELFETQMKNMIRTYQSLPTHPNVIVLTPFYSFKAPIQTVKHERLHNEIVPVVRKVAEDMGVTMIDIHEMSQGRKDLMTFDGVHPNAEGNQFIADHIYEAIEKGVH